MKREYVTLDGNEAAAYVAFNVSEVIAIYPITPSSGMGELSDAWTSEGKSNIWGVIPSVTEMQSEGGAAGAVHGALQGGALSTTFTASQGLLLMIPNMYKIAGELTPTVFHIAARSVATHALSIFGDHSDVMACRQTGWGMIASGSIQEVMDLALISHTATLSTRIPFLHFFDGFRSSHEVLKVERLTQDDMRAMIDDELILAHRERALTPDQPVLRGTAQNPDVFFQARETVNQYYQKAPALVQEAMDRFAGITGRQYRLFDYYGHPEAEKVVVLMGSGAETAHETVQYLADQGEKVGCLKVRLYRPFSVEHFVKAFPSTVKSIAVLDRTKEPGSSGEPLYLDVVTAYAEKASMNGGSRTPKIIGGRYGLSSKEFTPAMVKGVLDELDKSTPKNHFVVGIKDDVTNTSLDYDTSFSTENANDNRFRGVFVGLGSDGTVSASKNSIKIIGEETENNAQGYFVYDSKKAGAITKSHLRFGKTPIQSTYLIEDGQSGFVACHQFVFMEKFDILRHAAPGATFLLNSPFAANEVWDKLPRSAQQAMIDKDIKFYVIDAYDVAKKANMGVRINTIMQTCFFAIANILPQEEAIEKIKDSIRKTFGKRGEEVVQQNFNAVDMAVAHLNQVEIPSSVTSDFDLPAPVPERAPEFVKNVLGKMIEGRGDELPVSAFPVDGTFPLGTTKWEKRNIALSAPAWEPDICIQCGKCTYVCPHACIRSQAYDASLLDKAPPAFKHAAPRGKDWDDNMAFTIQLAPEDCTGCELCVEVCPAKSKTEQGKKALNMVPQPEIREQETANWDFFLTLPNYDRNKAKADTVKGSQFLEPLFEFSGACSGCGETPYVKVVSQLFGDRMVVANATGCSSIYGGNLPTTPWTTNADGRGPAWSNSLFEDNAEFGFGMRLAIEKKTEQAKHYVKQLENHIGGDLVQALLNAQQTDEPGIYEQRVRVQQLKDKIKGLKTPESEQLMTLADYLVKKSVWIIGGDGWAYDIGYGGLDHVIASGHDVNILILDTEVYSNTGGQMSKATPMGAIAKFAAGGKPTGKKDIGLLAMTYGNVYVARIAMGANDAQSLKAIIEAERYPGPSMIIAYTHCIAHGINMKNGLTQQKLAVESGYWPLFRFNPTLAAEGKNPLTLDSKAPKIPLKDYIYNEARFKMLTKMAPERAAAFLEQSQQDVLDQWQYYSALAEMSTSSEKGGE